MIIDVHAHIGVDRVFDKYFSEEDLVRKKNEYSINCTIVQPALVHTLEEVKKQHDDIAKLCNKYPNEFVGMANPNPHLESEHYENEIYRCVNDLGFVGVKIHPFAHGVNPSGEDGLKVFEIADRLNIPVMIHTGTGIPFSSPSSIIPALEKYPNVKTVLAHCGMVFLANEAFITMSKYDNLYADLSWTPAYLIKKGVDSLGSHRFMFGTDHADNCNIEIQKIQTSGINFTDQENIFYKTAMEVYSLNVKNKKG